jgi:ferredoxin-NADP reductase/predicted pyridoxine 5'-phosphate oxidase superfamily flavin-nucleotide-binding protein
MAAAFTKIAFTPSVKAAQTLYGSRAAYAGFEQGDDVGGVLGQQEAEFIQARDSFYQATVSETGWPYVQFRGGPAGFLKVLDGKTIAYADFRGNRQCLSVGNINADGRIALILMDYPNRRRLKIWGRAQVIRESENPDLVARLEMPAYRARIENAIVIAIEAYDWNCPQHIRPRFTEEEISAWAAGLLQEMAQIKEENARLKADESRQNLPAVLGHGPLPLVVSGVRQLTDRIRAYELRSPDGKVLPEVPPGAHLRIPIRLGEEEVRHYSLASNPLHRDVYEIAVLKKGPGSAAVHRDFALGLRLNCGYPGHTFALHTDTRPAVLIAGGIGITPIKAMAHVLAAQGREFTLHYTAKTPQDMAYRERLARELGSRVHLYYSAVPSAALLSADIVLRESPEDAVFYVCGPPGLLAAVHSAAERHGISHERIRFEHFTSQSAVTDQAVELELRRSGRIVQVAADQTLLQAIQLAGVAASYDCRTGVCGTCAVKVLEGIPDHRDSVLTAADKERAGLMCICISRAKTKRLVLDL